MMQPHINKIENLLHLDTDKHITAYKSSPLTAPGENYGSLMLKVDLTVSSSEGDEEIHAVAKMLPTSKQAQEFFSTKTTLRSEIAFYEKTLPLLQSFQKEHGVEEVIDFCPNYYGSRLNLNCDESKVDSDAVLLLENLKMNNYRTLDRTEGMNLDVAELILADLAHLHAVPMVLKLNKKEVFETKIRPHLSLWPFNPQFHDDAKNQIDKVVGNIPELLSLRDRILVGFDKRAEPLVPREPFATIIHDDCWTNNAMVKFEGQKPVKSKLIDFALCVYGSPARDVLFYLFSSVKPAVVEKHYDHLVKFYHKSFTLVLEKLNVDTAPFSFEAFEKELNLEAGSQFGHAMFMLFPIFATKEDVEKMLKMPECSPVNVLYIQPSDMFINKMRFIVREFAKRNWI